MFQQVDFSALDLPPSARALQTEVREFLRAEMAAGTFKAHLGHTEFNAEFSRKIGARGWIGMTWPKRYGGQERSYLDRFVMTEEMLAVAAPCAAHWFGDRQTGPSLLRYGSEAQRQRFLPAIARGEYSFALGMSEPNAGSDLAAVQDPRRARRRRLARQRPEGVDELGPQGRCLLRAVPHRARQRQPSRGPVAADRRTRTRPA